MSFYLLLFFARSLDSVKHFPLVFDNKKFVFGVGEFFNVEQLVEHFQNYPIIGGETGLTTCLLLCLLTYLLIIKLQRIISSLKDASISTLQACKSEISLYIRKQVNVC